MIAFQKDLKKVRRQDKRSKKLIAYWGGCCDIWGQVNFAEEHLSDKNMGWHLGMASL